MPFAPSYGEALKIWACATLTLRYLNGALRCTLLLIDHMETLRH